MKRLLLLITICISFVSFSQVPSYVPTNGLVGWWPFNGNANDEGGNGNNGTVNGAALTTDRFGNANSAYDFDGVTNFISIDGSGTIDFTEGVTFSAWINSNVIKMSSIVDKLDYACGIDNGYRLNTRNNGDLWAEDYCYGANGPNGLNATASSYNTNVWYHVVGTMDHCSGNRIYLNGVLMDYGPISEVITNLKTIEIGKSTLIQNEHFNGKIDDIGIWQRALTQCEVTALYSSQFFPTPIVNLGQDTLPLCASTTSIDAGTDPSWDSYLWNTEETTQNITVTQSGLYSVKVTDSNGCIGYDNVLVSLINPTIDQIDTNICVSENVLLNVNECEYESINLSIGLVGSWPFSGDANDISNNSNHGTVNGPKLIRDRFGNENSAFCFDGANDEIVVLDHPSLNLTQFSISGWVKPLSNQIGAREIAAKGEYPYNYGINLSGNENNMNGFYNDANNYQQITSTSTLSVGNWSHIVLTHNGSIAKLYINGVMESESNNDEVVVNNGFLYFGRTYTGFYMKGILDDIQIWNRAINKCEVKSLYSGIKTNITWSSGQTTQSITVQPTETTTYTVTVDDGISSCSDDVTITINDLVEAGTDLSVCNGDEITLSGSDVDTYVWSNGVADGVSFTPGSSSYYYVTGTDSFGCETSDSVYVTLLEPTTSSISESNCDNYTAPDGASYTVSGTYTAVIQNSVGCDSTITIDLTVLESPNLTFEVTEPECQGESSGTIVVNATNGIEPYSFIWSNGAVEAENNNIGAGTYEVTVTDNLGCETQGSVVVIDATESCFLIPGGLSPNGDGANETWEIGGLSQYPDAIISVFDRWGQKVYTGDYTSPPWDGTYNGSDLPTADYYYILDLGNGEKYNGVVTLKR